MDIWKFYDVTHRYHEVCNPTSRAKLDELVGLLKLNPESRVLDIACGKGELFGFSLIAGNPLLIMILPAGGFLAVGLLMGFFNWVDMRFFGGKGASGV